MKRKTLDYFTGILAFVITASFIPAGDCESYYPVKQGTVMEMKSYDEKDKPTGSVKSTIKEVKTLVNGVEINIQQEIFDAKDKPLNTTNFVGRCESGVFYVDMKSFLGGQNMDAYKNMEVKVEADNLDIPANPSPGQTLKGGTVKVSAVDKSSGMGMMNMVITVSNRKVEAIEDVTTPAGTFKCVKISYDTESQMLFKIKAKGVEWYSKKAGMVRSESYNSKGKLQGYTVLTSIK